MKLLVFLLLSFSIFSFAQEQDIINVMKAQQTEWNQGNIDGFMQGYHKSDSLVFIGSKGPTYGWQQTLDNYKKSYPDKNSMGTLEFSDISVKILGKKHALVIGKWKLIREKDLPQGNYTLTFQKFKNGWKIIADHTD